MGCHLVITLLLYIEFIIAFFSDIYIFTGYITNSRLRVCLLTFR